mgnify:CR=1 FL=1
MLLDTMMMYLNIAKLKAEDFFKDENGAVDIVAIVVLMGIVVLVALVFKDKLSRLVTDLFTTITGNATKAVNPAE